MKSLTYSNHIISNQIFLLPSIQQNVINSNFCLEIDCEIVELSHLALVCILVFIVLKLMYEPQMAKGALFILSKKVQRLIQFLLAPLWSWFENLNDADFCTSESRKLRGEVGSMI